MLACGVLLSATSQGAAVLLSNHANGDGTYGYFQNFDAADSSSFSLTALDGWQCYDIANLKASNGGVFSGGNYHFGSSGSGERALGSIASLAVPQEVYGLVLHNDSGKTLQLSSLSYRMEQWRCGSTTPNTLRLEYAVGNGLDFSSDKSNFTLLEGAALDSLVHAGVGALDGNLEANQRLLALANQPIFIAAGQNLVLRWLDSNETGNDQALAIDDFSLQLAEPAASMPEPACAMLLIPALAGVLLRRRR